MAKVDEPMELYHFHAHNEYDELFEQDEIDFSNITNQVGELVNLMSHYTDKEILNLIKVNENNPYLKSDLELVYRERVLERLRPQNQNIPSRQRCIYLCDEKGKDMWERVLSDNGKKLQLYKVEVARRPFSSNLHLLPSSEDLNYNYETKASLYWSPPSLFKSYSDLEYLYDGKVKILERVK